MTDLPKPFGYVRDNSSGLHVFQHEPFSEFERMLYSTETVYSHGQVRELLKASRKQMAEEAAAVCAALIPSGCSTSIADVSRNQGIRACADAIRSLATPTEGKT